MMVERILDWVEDTRMTQKVIVLLLSVGLTSIILFQFVVEPQQQHVQGFQQTLRSLDHQLATIEQSHQLEPLKDEIARLTPQLEAQKKVLRLKVPVEQMLTDVLDKAQSVGVVLTSWKSEEPVPIPETDLNRVTLRLYTEGRYHALAHFLEELQTLPNTLMLRSMDLQAQERSDESPERHIQASFELIGFQAIEFGTKGQRVPEKRAS